MGEKLKDTFGRKFPTLDCRLQMYVILSVVTVCQMVISNQIIIPAF